LVIAAIVHDLEHDGYNNNFHKNSSSGNALQVLYSFFHDFICVSLSIVVRAGLMLLAMQEGR